MFLLNRIEKKEKCRDTDNIFYEFKDDEKAKIYCALGKSVFDS